jgi:hypothetical protein
MGGGRRLRPIRSWRSKDDPSERRDAREGRTVEAKWSPEEEFGGVIYQAIQRRRLSVARERASE